MRWLGVLCLPATIAATVSYLRALGETGNTTAVEQSVEWLRGHHFGDTVSWVERMYYSHNQPPMGGTLANGLPAAVSNGTTPAGPAAAPGSDWIVPLATQPLPGEGVWHPYGDAVRGADAMQVAYLRPDEMHGTVLAAVVRINQDLASFRLVPGSQEPGGGPSPGGNSVSTADKANLLAGFNSGFRMADSRGGYAAGGHVATCAPMRADSTT